MVLHAAILRPYVLGQLWRHQHGGIRSSAVGRCLFQPIEAIFYKKTHRREIEAIICSLCHGTDLQAIFSHHQRESLGTESDSGRARNLSEALTAPYRRQRLAQARV